MANHHQQQQHRKPIVSHELALASDLFDKFCGATTLKTILSHYRSLCEILNMKPNNFPHFYPKLKSKLCSWRAQALWNKFDKRANHKCYNRGKACANTRVFIIGAGPCGLRAAIEAQLLGAKVVVIEKRDRISRNNVLHLWPFVIHDLRSLGAKKFFGKFCAGSIDHISIRQLQCILLKVALLLGVEIHEGVSFESLLPPSSHIEERTGWRAKISPEDHPVSQYEFDVLIGADGKRNTLEGFKRKEFRGKLAIAITANFINHRTEAEARVEEISGVAYIFNQKFFKDLRSATGIDLENIVYYKDDTHYFVMTAKKPSLLDKGVILKDYADTARLLAIDNINKDALMEYAKEAANFSTNYKLPELQFAVNHYGQPDVAMFDFTSMYAAENASRVIQEKGYKLLMCLVGDSLLEPFWPTGSGCARGFLSSMDACWAVRSWGSSSCTNPLEVMAERESIYRLLNQTTPENLSRDHANYMLDPHTRYANLNLRAVLPVQVKSLYSSDDPASIELYLKSPSSVIGDHSKKRRRRDTQIHHDVLLSWLKRQVALCDDIRIENTNSSFKNGLALCAIIYRYRPDLIDFHSLDPSNVAENNQLAFNVLEKEYGILPVMTGIEMEACETPDNLTMLSYLTQVYDVFRGEIPYSHQKRTDDDSFVNASIAAAGTKTTPYKNAWNKMNQTQKLSMMGRLASSIPRKRYRESRSPTVTCKSYDAQTPRKPKKRKSASTAGCSVDRDVKELQELKKLPMEVNFSGRIKDIETKLKEGNQLQKKPKDLMRAIGKIEKTDWNINALEKKIEENKFGRGMTSAEVAKVPKWNRQQFDDKFTAVKKKLIDKDTSPSRQPSAKYTDVDSTLKVLERKLRNGTVLEQGQRGANKVSAMAAQLATMNQQPEERCILKSASKLIIPNQGGSETCHFCNKRVYLMERLNAEGRFFHRGCFRCEYCGTALRLGNYNFDRDGKFGSRFYCAQHFGYPGVHRKKNRNYDYKSEAANEDTKGELDVLAKTPTSTMDLNFSTESTDTPERVGFENLDVDKEDARNASFSEMDEDEWTDHNFGTSANELASSDDVSNISESEEEDRGEFAQASDIPGPHDNKSLEFAQPRFAPDSLPSVTVESSSRRNSFCSARDVDENAALDSKDSDSSLSDDGSSPHITYHEFDSEESTTTAERDRVHLKVPKRSPCAYSSATSESDTEMGSDAYSTSSNNDSDEDIDAYYDDHEYDEDDDDDDDDEDEDEEEEEDDDDSATEISTDSEFERNNSTIIKSEMPDIIISGRLPTRKTRLEEVKSVQILDRSALICNKNVDKVEKDTEPEEAREDEVKLGKLPYANLPRKNYLINRTQSTEGVASKISLELKKKYLLGGDRANSPVKKSESTSVLDMKFKSLVDQISEHQKLLNPSTDPSQTSPQTFTETSAKLSPSIINASAAANSLNSRKSKELSGLEDFPHVCDLATNNFDRPIRKIQFGIENASQLEINAVATDKLTNESTLNSTPLESTVTEKVTGPVIEQDTSERRKSLESRITLDKTQIPNDFPKSESLPTNVQKAEAKCGFFVAPEQTSKTSSVEIDKDDREASLNKIMAMPLMDNSKDRDAQILRLVATPAELFVSKDSNSEPKGGLNSDKSSPSTPSSSQGDENTLAVFTETELSDWARDEDDAVSENLEDLILDPPTPNITYRRHQRPKKRAAANKPITLAKDKDDVKNDYVHVCGRTERPRPTSLALASLDDMDIDFMDTVVDDVYGHNMETINSALVKNRGYIEYVTNQEEIKTPLAETINVNDSSFTDRNIPTSRDNIVPEDHSCSSNNSIIDNSEEKIGQDSGVISKFEANVNDVKEDDKNNKVLSDDYDKFVHRLQERITPFNNVKDSIDIRKSRRSGKSNSPSPLTSPAVEEPCTIEPQPQVLQGSLQKLEKLEQERSKQKSIIHDMVMSKLQAQGKSIRDRKMKRNARNSLSPFGSSSQNSLLSRTSDEMKKDEIRFTVDAEDDKENTRRGPAAEKNYDHTVDWPAAAAAPPSHTIKDMYSESFSLPDLRKALNEAGDEPLSNVLPLPSPAKLQVLECTESIRQQARTRARLMSDSELGLSPEDKLRLLKQKIAARKAVQSAYMDYPKTNNSADAKVSYSNKVLDALDDVIRRDGENHKDHSGESAQTSRLKITRDKDRRKSIIRAVSDFFKKSPVKVAQSIDASVSGGSISPKFKLISSSFMGKEKSKINNAMSSEKDLQHSNLTRKSELERPKQDNTVPLSRLNYTSNSDENLLSTTSSTGNCDRNSTSLQSNNLRSSHRKAKQENQKRLRMAQEIQRQLEEIEVKQRELEIKGVNVEKALRNNQNSDCEFELMRELLDMIRERNELRKYEQKLLLKAKAIEADDPNLR